MEAAIYLWSHNYHIVISDVDGTITKSDVLGQVRRGLDTLGSDQRMSVDGSSSNHKIVS